eukprot:5974109-Alexandrium_andersonii.AAC.1
MAPVSFLRQRLAGPVSCGATSNSPSLLKASLLSQVRSKLNCRLTCWLRSIGPCPLPIRSAGTTVSA